MITQEALQRSYKNYTIGGHGQFLKKPRCSTFKGVNNLQSHKKETLQQEGAVLVYIHRCHEVLLHLVPRHTLLSQPALLQTD